MLRLSQTSDGVAFWIHVTPRATRASGWAACHGDALRVAVGAAPVEGAANAACVRALAPALGVEAEPWSWIRDPRGAASGCGWSARQAALARAPGGVGGRDDRRD